MGRKRGERERLLLIVRNNLHIKQERRKIYFRDLVVGS